LGWKSPCTTVSGTPAHARSIALHRDSILRREHVQQRGAVFLGERRVREVSPDARANRVQVSEVARGAGLPQAGCGRDPRAAPMELADPARRERSMHRVVV
jgi:hypothetical protein